MLDINDLHTGAISRHEYVACGEGQPFRPGFRAQRVMK